MSILIKGMEMPDSCYHCKIAESCGHYIANYTNRRHPECPLGALPDTHGRLVDADALTNKYGNWYVEEGTAEGFIGDLKHLIDLQPTIVESEGE